MPDPDPTGFRIGGAPLVSLSADPGDRPGLTGADLVPSRGMMLLRLRARLPDRGETDLVVCPPLAEARERLEDPADRHGNAGFAFGGALLLPFANRITGQPSPDGEAIVATSPYGPLTLPANWSGRHGPRYAMHGLILRSSFTVVEQASDCVTAALADAAFGEAWPGRFDITVTATLTASAFALTVEARNVGDEPAPMGIGWHPYFAVASRRRAQARLHIPGAGRVLVGDYDQVLPTGEVEPVAGSTHDFSPADGAPLGDLYLDDCFTDLGAAGRVTARLSDPAGGYRLSLDAVAPPVTAFQVYAPPQEPFVVIEPQYNLADPFATVWACDRDTGMIRLGPGETTRYEVSVGFEALAGRVSNLADESRSPTAEMSE